MIVQTVLSWIFPRRFKCSAESHLDATIAATLRANEKVARAAEIISKKSEINQAIMENVTFDTQRRVVASENRREYRKKFGPESALRGMLNEVSKGGKPNERT